MDRKQGERKRVELEKKLDEVRAELRRLEEIKASVEREIAALEAKRKEDLSGVSVEELERVAAVKADAEREIRKHELMVEELTRRIRMQTARVERIEYQLKLALVEEREVEADKLALDAAKHLEKAYALLVRKADIVRETSIHLGITPQSFFTSTFQDSVRNALWYFFKEYVEKYPESGVVPSVDLKPK